MGHPEPPHVPAAASLFWQYAERAAQCALARCSAHRDHVLLMTMLRMLTCPSSLLLPVSCDSAALPLQQAGPAALQPQHRWVGRWANGGVFYSCFGHREGAYNPCPKWARIYRLMTESDSRAFPASGHPKSRNHNRNKLLPQWESNS